eukprot:2875831-Rhodomonas_salina.1
MTLHLILGEGNVSESECGCVVGVAGEMGSRGGMGAVEREHGLEVGGARHGMVRAEKGAGRRYKVGHGVRAELWREHAARMPAALVA